MKKNMIVFNLMDAMTDDLCPICFLVHKRTLQLMDAFLYEGVNDSDNRNTLLQDGGFCPEHAKMLMELGNPLAHAILYQDLLRGAIRDADAGDFSRYQKHACMFCRNEQNTEKDYLLTFAHAFQDGDFRQKYRESGMLCLRHLQALSQMKIHTYPEINQLTIEKYQHLLMQLGQIIHKNDYRFSDEPWEKGAGDAWKRAVHVIHGQ